MAERFCASRSGLSQGDGTVGESSKRMNVLGSTVVEPESRHRAVAAVAVGYKVLRRAKCLFPKQPSCLHLVVVVAVDVPAAVAEMTTAARADVPFASAVQADVMVVGLNRFVVG